eukprot:3081621-Ditylum_brightwellii.AAC.1
MSGMINKIEAVETMCGTRLKWAKNVVAAFANFSRMHMMHLCWAWRIFSCHGQWLILKAVDDLSKGEGAVDQFCIGISFRLSGSDGR